MKVQDEEKRWRKLGKNIGEENDAKDQEEEEKKEEKMEKKIRGEKDKK